MGDPTTAGQVAADPSSLTLARIARQRRLALGLALAATLSWLLAMGWPLLDGRLPLHGAGMVSALASLAMLAVLLFGAWRMDELLRRAGSGIESVRASERQYRALADNLPDPLVRFDRQGRHLYANPGVQRATGLPPEAFIGKTNAELGMPPENVAQWSAVLRQVLETGRVEHLQFSYPGPHGVRLWESDVVPEPGADGRPATVLVISRDITDEHRAERALRRSELRFRLAASFGQVWDWDIETGAVELPEAFWRDLGHPVPQPPYRLEMLEAILHPEDRPRLRQALGEHLARHTPYALEFRAFAADGTERWFQTQGQAVWGDDGRATYMAGTTFDITVRKRGELEMRIKDAAFESALSGIALAGLDGLIHYVNPAFCRLWGITEAEAIGRSPVEFWRNPDEPRAVMHALAAAGRWAGEMEGLHADGHVLVADVSAIMVRDAQGQALCMMGTFVDITQRKRAEDALRTLNAELEQRVQARTAELALSEARYRTIFELVPVAIGEEDWSQVQQMMRRLRDQGVTDGPAHFAAHPEFVREAMRAVRLLRMNRTMLALHDARSQSEDLPTLEAVYGSPEFLPSFVGELEALWRGERLYRVKKTTPTVKGRLLSVMLTMSLPALEGGDGRALVTIVDISEIDRLNAELDASLARLKRINRELETFTYSVSHDLKAPLRGIDGYSRLLLRDHEASLDEEARGFLANIRQATQQMGRLIDDLLAYSRLERRGLELGPVALTALVPQVLSTFDDEIRRRGVALRLDLPPDLPAWGDAPGLQVALQNLIENALKFSRDTDHPAVTIGATDPGDGIVLSVQDNGLGFDMKFHDRIFDIFQRLHRAEEYPGTGVGLAIVRKAMERMGGRVWAESRPGAGATFHLQLPRMP